MGVTVAVDAMEEVVATVMDAMEVVVMALAVTAAVARLADGNQYLRWDVRANHVKVESAVSVLRLTVRHGTVSREYRAQVSAMHRDVR